MWLAVDRNRNQILDFEVTKTLDIWAYQTIADRLRKRYNINILCTDGDYAYDKLKIAKRHIITKSETCLVESKNTIIRRRLARFNRRTCRYSKAFDMVVASLTLLFRENIFIIYIYLGTPKIAIVKQKFCTFYYSLNSPCRPKHPNCRPEPPSCRPELVSGPLT